VTDRDRGAGDGGDRPLVPVRALGTQRFRGILRWFKPLVRVLYRAEGLIELLPRDEAGALPEKVEGLLNAGAV